MRGWNRLVGGAIRSDTPGDVGRIPLMRRLTVPLLSECSSPGLMQVSPVGTLRKAYHGLTGRPLPSLSEPAFPVGEGQQEQVEGPI